MNRPSYSVMIFLLSNVLAGFAITSCGANTKPSTAAPVANSVPVNRAPSAFDKPRLTNDATPTSTAAVSQNTATANPLNQPAKDPAKPNTAQRPAKEWLALAQQEKSPERENLLIQAAAAFADEKKFDKARNILSAINTEQLSDMAFVNYSQTLASIHVKEGDIESAHHLLTNHRLEQQFNALEPQQEADLRELRAQTFERMGQLHESIAERITVSAVITHSQAISANHDALWHTLMLLPISELKAHAAIGSGGITQGWYSLAALSKNNTQNIESQQAELNAWKAKWASHPAVNHLPKDLHILQKIADQQPKKIALLLPLEGRLSEAGEAVRDGFFAAYYHQLDNQTNDAQGSVKQRIMPSVSQYDTSKGALAAYQQALTDGADLIIGPLDKEDVNQISKLPALNLPVLTLNYPDQQPASPLPNFYQFGLAVEDEARQVARQAFQDGHKRALIVTPAQDISERSAQAFAKEWEKLGGTVIGKTIFTTQDKFAQQFRSHMLIDESQLRATLLQQQLATKFEFTPRCRTDIDMIFMAVTPALGRQIKPTFAFHYANNIPVYATSSIYSGDADATNNEDLNGVLFNTLPWIFDNTNPEKQAIAQSTKSSAVFGRLHALGADAFHLYPRLPQLAQAPQMRIYGATGSLQLLADGRIEREQMWAKFANGLAEPLATVVENTDAGAGE